VAATSGWLTKQNKYPALDTTRTYYARPPARLGSSWAEVKGVFRPFLSTSVVQIPSEMSLNESVLLLKEAVRLILII
jgi:hypothetical protein